MSKASNASRPVLYKTSASTPSSAVTMLADILGLQIDFKLPDLWNSEQHLREFKKKLNPMGTIPVLQDGDLIICESHAIIKYLLSKYGGEQREKLYPSDFNKRAIIDHLIFWETGVLFIRLKVAAISIVRDGLKAPTEQHKADIDEAFSVLEANLVNRLYIAADHLTIADLSLGSTATSIQAIHKLDSNRFPLTAQWLARLNEEECFKNINQLTVLAFSEMINTALEKNNN